AVRTDERVARICPMVRHAKRREVFRPGGHHMETLIIFIVVCILYWAIGAMSSDWFFPVAMGLAIILIVIMDSWPQSASPSPSPSVVAWPPPRQYDPWLHPYTGELTIRRVTMKEVRKLCSLYVVRAFRTVGLAI